jgi:AraC family transcriptional regulator of adaptative response / DNA-3-methyladenine glycosylase II
MAAGFGSLRRFNETFRHLFDRPPRALRRTGGGDDAAASHAIILKLPYRPPYDFAAMLRFLKLRAIPGVEAVTDRRYARTIEIDGAQGSIAVEAGAGAWLTATIRCPQVKALPVIIARIRRVFDLAADPVAIGQHLSEDPALARLVAARPGLRVPGAWDGFELAVRAVLGQQITVVAASKLAGKLVQAHGTPLPSAPAAIAGLTHLFPAPERLATSDLAALGMPRQRAATLSALAAAVLRDPAIFGARRSLEDAIAALRSLSGIGEWTAQYIAMRQLREPDAFPAADIGLLRAMADAAGNRPTPADLLARAEAWRPWRAYAAIHLWAAGAGGAAGLREETEHDREAA